MSTAKPKPSRTQTAIAGAILALLAALFIWAVSFSPWKLAPFALAGQAYMLIAILLAFRYWPPMVRWVTSMPVPHRTVFATLIAAMILGHYTLNSRTYFPFVVWEIFPFVREEDPVTCREFIATTESGRKVRLLVEQLFPSIVQFNPPLDADGNPLPAMEPLVRAMAKVYNAHHADDPVHHVDLMVMAIALHPPASESRPLPSCELLKRYDTSSAR
jgi:hypothetical protein